MSTSRCRVIATVAVLPLFLVASACSSSSSGSASTTAGAGTAAVTIKDYAFHPGTITVKAGTTVVWTNEDQFAHAIKDPATGQSGAKNIDPSTSYRHTYAHPGTYPYVCAIHPNMHGIVKVTSS